MLNTTKQQIETGTGEGGELLGINICFAVENHRNQQYSVTAITNSSAGVVERYAYQAYGEPTILDASASVLSSSSISNRYTYTGREWDGTIGLYHFRARWMSGLTGRFLTRDPIGYEDGPVLYGAYFGLNSTDPEGLDVHSCTVTRSNLSLGARDEERFKATEFQKLSERISKLLKIADLQMYWDFQVEGELTQKNCLETCCGRDVPYNETELDIQGNIVFGFTVPANVIVTIQGEFKISASLRLSVAEGGCKGVRRRNFCGSLNIEGDIKVCAGKKKWGWGAQACVGIKTNCGLFGKCEDNASPGGKCSVSIYGSACLGSGILCGEYEFWGKDFDPLGIFG
jgi:RHS repeat-associated protein